MTKKPEKYLPPKKPPAPSVKVRKNARIVAAKKQSIAKR